MVLLMVRIFYDNYSFQVVMSLKLYTRRKLEVVYVGGKFNFKNDLHDGCIGT